VHIPELVLFGGALAGETGDDGRIAKDRKFFVDEI